VIGGKEERELQLEVPFLTYSINIITIIIITISLLNIHPYVLATVLNTGKEEAGVGVPKIVLMNET